MISALDSSDQRISRDNTGKANLEKVMLFSSEKTKGPFSKRSIDIICLAIFLVSIAVRLVKLVFEPLLLRDGALYLRLAEVWYQTGVPKGNTSIPFLPLLCIKTLMGFCGDSEIAGRSITLFLGGLIPVIGFILARMITHNIRFSLIAALCFILHPNLVSYSIQPLRENYYILLIGLLMITMVWNFRNTRTAGWIACGAIIGIAFFCRLESLEFLVIVAVEIAILELKKKKILSFLKSTCVFLLAFALTLISMLAWINGDSSFVMRVENYRNKIMMEWSRPAR